MEYQKESTLGFPRLIGRPREKTFGNGLKGILTTINTALANTDWQAIGTGIATFIKNIDWSGIGTALSAAISNALKGFGAVLAGLLKVPWEGIKSYFEGYINEYGGNIIAGLLAGIGDAIIGIGNWIEDNIFRPFIDGFKSVFGIASPSTVMEEQGGFMIDGLLSGLKAAWNSITGWFGTILSNLGSQLSKAWGGHTNRGNHSVG